MLLIVHLVVILIGYFKCCTTRNNVEIPEQSPVIKSSLLDEIPHASHELLRAEDKLWTEIQKNKTI